mgnify:CR=1 FL=1
MKPNEYIQEAIRTERIEYDFSETNGLSPRVEHAVMGLVTEAGELMSVVKKAKIYGKKPDAVNIIEEAGDVMWYLAVLADELGVSFEEIWDKNIRKLQVRFPEKYDRKLVSNRKLNNERSELEK